MNSFPLLEDIVRDTRFALRQLCKSPGFTTAAILAFGSGHRNWNGHVRSYLRGLIAAAARAEYEQVACQRILANDHLHPLRKTVDVRRLGRQPDPRALRSIQRTEFAEIVGPSTGRRI